MPRTLDRYLAHCNVEGCIFNARKEPAIHRAAEKAIAEAQRHARSSGHVGVRSVKVERIYKVESERIVG